MDEAQILSGGDPAMASGDLFGLVRIGAMHVALPIGSIREVVPYPDRLTPIPASMPQLRGAIDLRGALVPVLDLSALLGAGAEEGEGRAGIIMVLRVRDRVIGVSLHEICGVISLSCHSRTVMEVLPGGAPGASGIVAAGFVCDGRSGAILDAGALAHLPGIAMAEDRLVSTVAHTARGAPTLTMAAGDFRLGLPARVIEATLPSRPVMPGALDDGLWIGRIAYNGASIPVVDTLALLGVGHMPPARETATVLLRMGDGRRVALRIDAVLDMVRVTADSVAGLQGYSVGHGGLVAGLLPADRPVLMLDPDALTTQQDLRRLSDLEEKLDTPGAEATTGASAAGLAHRQPYLIFTLAGGHHAVPLAQVTEILNHGACSLVPLDQADSPYCAVLSHRGLAIPIIDLAPHLGLVPCPDPAFILLVSDGARTRGFLLEGLCAVERLVAQAVAPSGGRLGLPPAVVLTAEGKTCVVLNLADLAIEE